MTATVSNEYDAYEGHNIWPSKMEASQIGLYDKWSKYAEEGDAEQFPDVHPHPNYWSAESVRSRRASDDGFSRYMLKPTASAFHVLTLSRFCVVPAFMPGFLLRGTQTQIITDEQLKQLASSPFKGEDKVRSDLHEFLGGQHYVGTWEYQGIRFGKYKESEPFGVLLSHNVRVLYPDVR